MKKHLRINGLVAAPFAPMNRQGEINLGIIPDYYCFLEKNGVKSVFINGTTGEGPSLTQKEKQLITEKWAESYKADRRVRIINLVGGTSYMECIENAIHSMESGIEAIAVIGPYFFRPADDGYLSEFVARIGEAVPGMSVYYYHIPSVTGVSVPMFGFMRRISSMLPNFGGIKFSHEDLPDFSSCLYYENRKYQVFWGRDESMLSALVLGAEAFVGSTYNYAAPLYLQLIEAFRMNDLDEARRLQQKSVEMISLLGKYGGIGTGKAFMRYIGQECGNYRSPVKNLTDDEFRKFSEEVKSLNMPDLFSKP